ncbi:MAG: GTPase Era [Alphaproteobacteria bacterium]|jgi:GTP-binding protein Era|nr:GTPase Era [SAR116 cluster bacterium]MBT3655378.1 GTPase Era [Alphaproteobacteria bacterium]MBT4847859.1 GTPase Era [Alphaproteobacteria bacterium]MBT5729409.1 GTPase Era [Alphaproteobacteria bacterium]MDA8882132.1 GTPase Era [Alphaproteobacteria bacterium]
MDNTQTRSGFVALIGPPNAGKSTLMNQMVGQKVSIVTPKVQTTRSRIRGIAMKGTSQMVFVDTPGIFTPKRRLDRAMVHAAWQGADDGDVLLLLHDCARKVIDDDTLAILAKIKEQKLTVSLILNKTDLATPEKLLTRTKALSDEYDFEKIFMVSAEYGHGVEDVKSWLAEKMPLSPYLFDPEDLSDLPQRLLAAEVLREKLFLNLHQELPYQMTVETDSWEEKKDGSAEIRVSVYVSREGHRGIVLGKGGQTLRRIGQSARLELEEALDRRIHLLTHVKYRKDWMDDKERYADWDLNFDA